MANKAPEDKKLTILIVGKPNTAKGFMASKIAAALTHFGQGSVVINDEDSATLTEFDEYFRTFFFKTSLRVEPHQADCVAGFKEFIRDQPVEIQIAHLGRDGLTQEERNLERKKQELKLFLGSLPIMKTNTSAGLFEEACRRIDDL